MLILTRRIGESIIIKLGEAEVWVRINAVKGTQVRMGIDAPAEVLIKRKEFAKPANEEKRA